MSDRRMMQARLETLCERIVDLLDENDGFAADIHRNEVLIDELRAEAYDLEDQLFPRA